MCPEAIASKTDTNNTVYALKGFCFEDRDTNNPKDREWQDMERSWINIEGDPGAIDEDIYKAME